MTHRCRCSLRALGAFVGDFAGVKIPTGAPRAYLQRRNLGMRPSLQFQRTPEPRLELAAVSRSLDDAIIPFDLSGIKSTSLSGVDISQVFAPKASDDVREPELNTTKQEVLSTVGAQHVSVVAQTSSEASEDTSRSDRRKGRKLRRKEAGLWRPLASAQDGVEEVDERFESVLKKIDALDGGFGGLPAGHIIDDDRKFEHKPAQRMSKRLRSRADSKKPVVEHKKPKKDRWMVEKAAVEEKYKEALWQPRKRLSPDTLEGIRALRNSDPTTYTTPMLADHFKVSAEVIQRILRSKWQPSEDEAEDRRERWLRRGVRKWAELAEQGVKPPKKWRELGVGSLKGEPEAKPAWKKGGKRRNIEVHPSWDSVVKDLNLDEHGPVEDGIAERLL